MNRKSKVNQPLLSTLRSLLHDQCGSVLVDFSLSIGILLLVLFGILDCSRVLFVNHFIASSARQAARYAMVRGSSWNGVTCASTPYACTATSADVKAYIMQLAPSGIDASKLVVNVTWPGTIPSGSQCSAVGVKNQAGCVVAVAISYPFSFVLPFMPANAWPLATSSSMTIAY